MVLAKALVWRWVCSGSGFAQACLRSIGMNAKFAKVMQTVGVDVVHGFGSILGQERLGGGVGIRAR